MKPSFLLFCLGLLFAQLQAQTLSDQLSLDACIDLAQTNSPAARIAGLEFRVTERSYDAFRASLKPQLIFNADAPGFSRTIVDVLQPDGSIAFRAQQQTFSAVGLSVSQVIPQTGGRISVGSYLSNFTNLRDSTEVFWQSTPVSIRYTQPIFQPNEFRWNQRQQSLQFELAGVDFVQDMEFIAVEITSFYFDALIAKLNMEREEFNLTNNDTIYTISKGRFSVGKIAENELLQSELSYMNAQASFEQAKISYDQAIQNLKTALGIAREEALEVFLPPALPQVNVSPEYALERALEHSPLVQQLELQKFSARRNLQRAKLNGRFSANLNASFGLNQTAATFSESYKSPVSQQAVSLGVQIPIIQWGQTKAEVDAALAAMQSTELAVNQSTQEFKDDVYYQVLGLRQLYRQLEISARSDTVAQKRYEITKNRYLIGKVDIQSLFIAQAEKDAAQQTNVANLRAYYLALARLRATTLYDFIEDRPLQVLIPKE